MPREWRWCHRSRRGGIDELNSRVLRRELRLEPFESVDSGGSGGDGGGGGESGHNLILLAAGVFDRIRYGIGCGLATLRVVTGDRGDNVLEIAHVSVDVDDGNPRGLCLGLRSLEAVGSVLMSTRQLGFCAITWSTMGIWVAGE